MSSLVSCLFYAPSYVEFPRCADLAVPFLDLSAYTSLPLWLFGLELGRLVPSPPAHLFLSRIRYMALPLVIYLGPGKTIYIYIHIHIHIYIYIYIYIYTYIHI